MTPARKPLPPSALFTWLPIALAALAGGALLIAHHQGVDTTTLAILGVLAGVLAKVGVGTLVVGQVRQRLKRRGRSSEENQNRS